MSEENTNLVDSVESLTSKNDNPVPAKEAITSVTDSNGNIIKLDQTNGSH